jgi:hypothetical protein
LKQESGAGVTTVDKFEIKQTTRDFPLNIDFKLSPDDFSKLKPDLMTKF